MALKKKKRKRISVLLLKDRTASVSRRDTERETGTGGWAERETGFRETGTGWWAKVGNSTRDNGTDWCTACNSKLNWRA